MIKMTEAQAQQQLQKLNDEFAHWRQTRSGIGERIPEPLWAKAVELSRILPSSRVAKQLRLSQTALRDRRLGKLGKSAKPAQATKPNVQTPVQFIELPSGAQSSTQLTEAPISIELERADGARLRLRFAQAPQFETLLKNFLA